MQSHEIQNRHWEKDQTSRRSPEHPVVVAAFSPLALLVASIIEEPEHYSVLDVGCGNGFLSYALGKRFGKVAGVDYSLPMLRVNPCRNKYLGSSSALPFSDKSFDIVVASHLLHHLVEADRLRTLAEMVRVARVAVVSFEPNRNNALMFLFALVKKEERMVLRFSRSYMNRLFDRLDVKSYTTHIEGWIVPNKAPTWWIPIGQLLARMPLRGLGFDICSIGILR